MNYVISMVIKQPEKLYCNNMIYDRIDYSKNPFKRKNCGGYGEGKGFFSIQASLPKDLASVEKNLTFNCYRVVTQFVYSLYALNSQIYSFQYI